MMEVYAPNLYFDKTCSTLRRTLGLADALRQEQEIAFDVAQYPLMRLFAA